VHGALTGLAVVLVGGAAGAQLAILRYRFGGRIALWTAAARTTLLVTGIVVLLMDAFTLL
jgi:hypothetical protein